MVGVNTRPFPHFARDAYTVGVSGTERERHSVLSCVHVAVACAVACGKKESLHVHKYNGKKYYVVVVKRKVTALHARKVYGAGCYGEFTIFGPKTSKKTYVRWRWPRGLKKKRNEAATRVSLRLPI